MELIRESRGREVHLQMEDHRTEEFLSKKSRFQAFGGSGQVLGSPAPSVSGATASQATLTAAAAAAAVSNVTSDSSGSGDEAANEQLAISQLNLNDSEPTTNVQIRLADGSRLIGRFNHSHTVGQLRQYILT